MFGGFFGEFLVSQGAISRTNLESAVQVQRENRLLLGELALQKGYISNQRLTELLNLQASEQKKFGTIAVEKGALKEEQLHELLEIQSQNHLYLGDALVRNGTLDPAELGRYLDLYREERQSLTDDLRGRIDELPHSEVVYLSLEMIRSFFFRLGFVVKTDDVLKEIPPVVEEMHVILGEQWLRHREVVYFGPALPDSIESLILSKHVHEGNGRTLYEKIRNLEDLEQIFYNLNFAICRELRSARIRAHHGSVGGSAPKGFRATSFRLIGMMEPVYALYYAR